MAVVKKLRAGEWVMVCRPCNFGLCEVCYGESQVEDTQTDRGESSGTVADLCGLGFSYIDAKNALKAANGDAEQAASLLLAAADMDIEKENQPSELHGRTDAVVSD